MMNCLQVTRSASDFLERNLRFRDRMAFLMHVAMCRGCRAYLEQIRLTILGLRSLIAQPVEAGPRLESLIERYREETRRKDH